MRLHTERQVGNLHFPAQFHDAYLLVEGDYAVRLMLERNQIPFDESTEEFSARYGCVFASSWEWKITKIS